MSISYTKTFDLDQSFALDDLGMTLRQDDRLREALDSEDGHLVKDEIEQRITAKLREHGVDTEDGEWLGAWSAVDIVTEVLASRGWY